VVTLEPGLYSPRDRYGVRLEDLVILGEDGIAEDLTPLPYELDPLTW
jgi:Xaa-Pro aminopeptidase